MNYKLIKAKHEDIDELIRYKEESILPYIDPSNTNEINKIKKYIKENIPKQLNNYQIIMLDKEKIGAIFILKREQDILIDELYIKDKYRNQGIGTHILKDILLNNKIVYLYVHKSNKRAMSLYKKLNFMIDNEDESRYYMKYER